MKTTGQPVRPGRRSRLRLGALIGSGDRIGAFVLPLAIIGAAPNIAFPEAFSVGGPPPWLRWYPRLSWLQASSSGPGRWC